MGSTELRDAMRTETRMFFEFMCCAKTGRFRISWTALHVSQRAAGAVLRHSRREGAGIPQVELTRRPARRLLAQASVLTVSSYPSRTSVVLRGK